MFNRLKKLSAAFRSSLMRRRLPPVMTRLARDERGVIIVMFALLLPIMIGFIGMGVEVAYWFQDRRDLQAAADAAAIAGAYEIAEGRVSAADTVAQREAEANGWSSSEGAITINNEQINSTDPSSGNFDDDDNAIEVILTRTLNPQFIGYFMDTLTLTAVAVATVVAGANTACVLALGSGNTNDAIKVSGNADITMTGCTLATNSTDDRALRVKGSAKISVDCAYSSGGADVTSGLKTTQCSGAKTNQPTVTDPYAEVLTEPADDEFDSCTTFSSSGSGDTIDPGVFCGIQFNDNGQTLTMNAGTYYLDKGDFRITSSNVTVQATGGVTVVFGDSTDGNNCGELRITGQATLNITAPDANSGEPFPGVAFYRGPSCDAGAGATLSGGSSSSLTGVIYMPSAKLKYTGDSSLSGSCVQMIADTVEFTGTGTIGTVCPANSGLLSILAGGKGSLVE